MSLKDAFVAQNGIFFQSKAGEISVTSFLNFWFTGGATWWLYMAAMHQDIKKKLNWDAKACGLQRKLPLWHQIKVLALNRTYRFTRTIPDDHHATNQ